MKVKLLFPLFALLFSTTIFSQTINQPDDMFVCDASGNGFAEFDLESQNAQILGGLNPANYTITYHETQADAGQQVNPLTSPYTNTSNPQTIYVAILENATGNLEITSFNLFVDLLSIPGFSQDVIACDEGGGFAVFDLTEFDDQFIGPNGGLTVSYFLTFQDAISNQNEISNPSAFTNTIPYFQTIFPRIEDPGTGCFHVSDNTVLYLNVSSETIISDPDPYVICDDNDDGIATFNLDTVTSQLLNGNQNPTLLITYHEAQADADVGVNALNPIYTNTIPFAQIIWVRAYNQFGDCYAIAPLELQVDTTCISVSSVEVIVCGDDPNTPVNYDLTSQETNMVNGQDSLDFNYAYYASQVDAENQNNPIANPEVYTVSGNSSTVYVRIENNQSGVSEIVAIFVNFSLGPQIIFNDFYTICSGQEIVITPFVSGNINNNISYLWNTGATDPEIVVFQPGVYSVTVTDNLTNCSSFAEVLVEQGNSPLTSQPENIVLCESSNGFDLTSVYPELLNNEDPTNFNISFHLSSNDAFNLANAISTAEAYVPNSNNETIFVAVQNISDSCFSIESFQIISELCPIEVICGDTVNTSYCYDINDATPYVYESSDGSQLQVFFNAGQVEVDWDELVVLDSDGVTNLNAGSTIYGNNGDLTGLSFTSSGSTITVYVDSDQIFSCTTENYTPIDYDVSCVDPNALPNCNSVLVSPENGEIDVNETTDLTWTASSGVVNGYKLSVGITSGGTEVLDQVDVGDVLTYDIETLDYEVMYYVTITPYNDNGDAIACNEQSFTTRANPNQTVICDDGAVNTTYCYGNNDNSEFNFQSSDGQALTLFFNAGGTEVNFDEIEIIDSDGSVMNPNLPYGNNGDFSGLTYTSSGDSISVRFNTDGSISCQTGNTCCTAEFDFDVFCSSSVGLIEVNAFFDANTNAVYDANESGFSNGYFTYEVNGDGVINTVNSSTGSFQIISANETDVYSITFNLYEESAGCYDVTTTTFDAISVATGNTITVDFPVVEEQSCEDLAVYLINNWTPPRPGFTHTNYLYLENLGFTTIASGTVEFTIDPLMSVDNIFSVNPSYTITTTATGFLVDFVNLQPGEVESIGISIFCPATVELGEIVTNTATYVTDSNDLVAVNNYSTLSEIVVGSWDPNDKMEAHGPEIVFDDFVTSDEYLYYTIRFQNMGTFPATFVRIEDELDNQLDETSFQMLRASHDVVVTRTDSHLEWYFDNINLPAEQDDAEGSQGFVYFKIKPKAGYAIGDIIPNTAAIYFDFNAPVITNRFDSQFVSEPLSLPEVDAMTFDMFPNPAKENVTVRLNSNSFGNVTIRVIDLQGKQIIEQPFSEEHTMELDVSDLQSGMYFVKLNSKDNVQVKKLIIE